MKELVSIYLSNDKTKYKKLYKSDLNENGYCPKKYEELDKKEFRVNDVEKLLMKSFEQASLEFSRISLLYDTLRMRVMSKYDLSEDEFTNLLKGE